MNVIAIAIETTHSLNGSVERVKTPQEAVKSFVRDLKMEDGEWITLILATVLDDEHTTKEQALELQKEVERLFEAAVPELFHPQYEWTQAV